MTYCEDAECKEWYPYYGLAPHSHNLSKSTFIGSTEFEEKSSWPNNFLEDQSEPGMGTWLCPKCLNGISKCSLID